MYQPVIPPIPDLRTRDGTPESIAFRHLDHMENEEDETSKLYHALNKAYQIVDAHASRLEIWEMRDFNTNGDRATIRQFADRIREMRDEAEHALSLVRAALGNDIHDIGGIAGWGKDEMEEACAKLGL